MKGTYHLLNDVLKINPVLEMQMFQLLETLHYLDGQLDTMINTLHLILLQISRTLQQIF